MRILVLGGCGLQGRAVLHDLSRQPTVEHVVCADRDLAPLGSWSRILNMKKIEPVPLDVCAPDSVLGLMKGGVDVVIDMLPSQFQTAVAEMAIEAGVHVVSANYGYTLPQGMHARAADRGVTVMPESGLDPGIDLVLCGYGVRQLDEIWEFHSYCGGFPESAAADNPLKYKITWTWHGVLLSYKRKAVMIREGRAVTIPPEEQHSRSHVGVLDFPGVGLLETIPNGNAAFYCEHLGILGTVRNASRWMMRWPGHAQFWKAMMDLKFLSDDPVPGLPEVTPHQFLVKHLEPQLQYRDNERDVVAMRNVLEGAKDGRRTRITFDLLDMRDLETGLFAMNRTTGYTASIVAQMIALGIIKRRGVLTAVCDIPAEPFLTELRRRGISVTMKVEPID